MGEKRYRVMDNDSKQLYCIESVDGEMFSMQEIVELLNEQQELIEELQVSDEMGWKRAERFEKKCPKELHNKEMYIKRLEYKVQKFKEMNNEQQNTIRELRNENIILKNKIEDLRVSLFIQDQVLQRQMQKSDLDE